MRSPAPPLPAAFFEKPVLQLTRQLIGCHLVRRHEGQWLVGRIVETEAYAGCLDPAAHTYRGETQRCRAMFGPPGHAYVYFTYGNHHCVNVTARRGDIAAAVLLRAAEPILGLDAMRVLRAAASTERLGQALLAGRADRELCNGPGKLAAAFGLDLSHDGLRLDRSSDLWIAAGTPAKRVDWTPRIGLGQNPAAPWLWRCVDSATRGATRVPGTWPRANRPTPTLGALRQAGGTAE